MNRHDRRVAKAKWEADLRQGVDRAIAAAVRAVLLVDSGLRRDGQIVWMRTDKPLPEDEPPVH
jgi:hypothetical protein